MMKMVTFSIRKRFLGIADCKRPFNNLGFNMWPTRTFAFSCYGPHLTIVQFQNVDNLMPRFVTLPRSEPTKNKCKWVLEWYLGFCSVISYLFDTCIPTRAAHWKVKTKKQSKVLPRSIQQPKQQDDDSATSQVTEPIPSAFSCQCQDSEYTFI